MKQQNQLYDLFLQWQKHLDNNNLIDRMVTVLNPEIKERYAAIYLDESQNLPPVALCSLVPRVIGTHFFASLDT